MTRVSVIIPCFNHGGFLAETVDSVLAQTFRDFEVIIVNDGSTDDTRDVALRLIDENPGVSIKLVDQENRGLSGARNAGIAAAEGEYVLPLDADDKLMPDYLEKTVGALDADPGMTIAYTDWRMFGDVTPEQGELRIGREFDADELFESNFLPATSLYRKSAWEESGGYKEEMAGGYEDWEFWVTLAEKGKVGVFIDERLFLYRKHGSSMIDGSRKRHDELFAKIRALHPGVYDKDRLEKIIVSRGAYIRELEELVRTRTREAQAYIDVLERKVKDLRSVRGFLGVLRGALARRLGVGAPGGAGGRRRDADE